MIEGQRTGVEHIPCWLVTDIRSFHRYVVGGHLPLPMGFRPEEPGLVEPVREILHHVDKTLRRRSTFDPRNDAGVQGMVFGGIYNVKRLQPGVVGPRRRTADRLSGAGPVGGPT